MATATSKLLVSVDNFAADLGEGEIVIVHKGDRALSSDPVVQAHPDRFREKQATD
jgi:hypothetical protein